jgi:molybdopterin-binding protein
MDGGRRGRSAAGVLHDFGTGPAGKNPWREKMKLSARNLLKGTIVDVKKGQTTAHVRIDVAGTVVTASITNEAVDELKLQKGQQAYAVIKASDVMIAID